MLGKISLKFKLNYLLMVGVSMSIIPIIIAVYNYSIVNLVFRILPAIFSLIVTIIFYYDIKNKIGDVI